MKISDLTPQEHACFNNIDRQVPGSNLVGIAQALAQRVDSNRKGRIRSRIAEDVDPVLWDLFVEYRNLNGHDDDHIKFVEGCMACRIERAIETLGEETAP